MCVCDRLLARIQRLQRHLQGVKLRKTTTNAATNFGRARRSTANGRTPVKASDREQDSMDHANFLKFALRAKFQNVRALEVDADNETDSEDHKDKEDVLKTPGMWTTRKRRRTPASTANKPITRGSSTRKKAFKASPLVSRSAPSPLMMLR